MLTPEDQALLEATVLPALERHFLRLLAHGLRTFQAIAATTDEPARLPEPSRIQAWAALQPAVADDRPFQEAFVAQLCRLREPLETLAVRQGRSPLELRMEELVAWVSEQAEARLTPAGSSSRPAGQSPPPG